MIRPGLGGAWDGACEVAGPADAPAILFLHGTRVTRDMWHPQVGVFATDHRVVTLDLPAHGVLKDVPFRLVEAARHVREAIDEAAGGRAILVGQSMGGYVAMMVAAEHPEAVAGLVLCNCSAEPRSIARRAPGTIRTYLVGAVRERIRGREPSAQAWLPAGPAAPAADTVGTAGSGPVDGNGHAAAWGGDGDGGLDRGLDSDGDAAAAVDPPTHGVLFRGSGRAVAGALRRRFLPLLAAYPGPTVIVNGEHDRIFRRGEQQFLAACQDGRLEIVGGAGHMVSLEQPGTFNTIVRRFVDDVAAGRQVGWPGSPRGTLDEPLGGDPAGPSSGTAGEPGSHPGEPGSHPGEPGTHPGEPGTHPGELGSHPGEPASDAGDPRSRALARA